MSEDLSAVTVPMIPYPCVAGRGARGRGGMALILAAVWLAVSSSLASALDTPPQDAAEASHSAANEAHPPASPAPAVFEAERRAVSNWQTEAIANLDLTETEKPKLRADGLANIPRCVKLNNYWCIKRARWAGEIAADAENHVAFASAIDGAIAASLLLRRYYLDYNRRSALAILSRWAPAQCGAGAAAVNQPRAPRAARLTALRQDAPHGIQNTLRARWLAAHRPGFANSHSAKAPRRSIVRSWPVAMMPAPEIAAGMGETPRAPNHAPIPLARIAALDFAAPASARPGPSCAEEAARIENYAVRAIAGIAASPNEDLNLFLADGTARASLAQLMENMAKVEIGPMAARTALISAAIAKLGPPSLAEGTARPDEEKIDR